MGVFVNPYQAPPVLMKRERSGRGRRAEQKDSMIGYIGKAVALHTGILQHDRHPPGFSSDQIFGVAAVILQHLQDLCRLLLPPLRVENDKSFGLQRLPEAEGGQSGTQQEEQEEERAPVHSKS